MKTWILMKLFFIRRLIVISGFFGLMTSQISYDWAALLIRLAIGLAWLPYGLKKLFYQKDSAHFPAVWPFSPRAAYYASMIIEIGVSLCLIFGFCTRLAVIPGMVCMAVATKVNHGPCFTAPALPYLLGQIAIFFIGSGAYSLDYLFQCALMR